MCCPQVRRRRLLYLVVGRRRVDISPIIRLALLYLSYYYDYCHTTAPLAGETINLKILEDAGNILAVS